jgi:hypothetical protein
MKILTTLFVLLSLSLLAQQPVQNFSLVNVADNSTVSLESYPSCIGIVVLFTGNECVYDGYYMGRIRSLIDAYKGKIQFLLVNSYAEPNEAIDKMKDKYNSWSMGVPYLADKEQVAMEGLGARKSPEAFLLKNMAGKFTIEYSGAIDDNAQMAADVKQNYLKSAIEKLLVNRKQEVSAMRAVGCTIRRK